MTKIGKILSDTRKQKKFTLDDVHKFVKIHPDFLKALEEGDYMVFSDEIHAKGFLKNYAEFLELDVNKILALWRREYGDKFGKNDSQNFKMKKLEPTKLTLTPGLILTVLSIFLITGFFGYLFYQYRSYSGAPDLDIYSPKNNTVVNNEVLDLTGKTDRDSVLLINNQRVILDKDGTFATSLKLKSGLNTLSFLSVNKLGKETEEVLTIIFREQNPQNIEETDESTESSESIEIAEAQES